MATIPGLKLREVKTREVGSSTPQRWCGIAHNYPLRRALLQLESRDSFGLLTVTCSGVNSDAGGPQRTTLCAAFYAGWMTSGAGRLRASALRSR